MAKKDKVVEETIITEDTLSVEIQNLLSEKNILEKEIDKSRAEFAKDFENKTARLWELEKEIKRWENFLEKQKVAQEELKDLEVKKIQSKEELQLLSSERALIESKLEERKKELDEKELELWEKSLKLDIKDSELNALKDAVNARIIEAEKAEADLKKYSFLIK